jgi:trans-2,3-dihydro-3-hydroxyanthranilate isomerase
MKYYKVDVFANGPGTGNPLGVFVDSGDLTPEQMQSLATELNYSETTFVSNYDAGSYEMRIFTPADELPFAGHPTIGTSWLLRHLGKITDDKIEQRTSAGTTVIRAQDDLLWFERRGTSDPDIEGTRPNDLQTIAKGLGISTEEIGLEAREVGRSGRLTPAFANAGLRMLMVPLPNKEVLARVHPPTELDAFENFGAYCFCAVGAGRMRARGLWPGQNIPEDPATGAAAAALGVYLGSRIGDIGFEIEQGVEMGRPCRIFVSTEGDEVQVGGRCSLAKEDDIEAPGG